MRHLIYMMNATPATALTLFGNTKEEEEFARKAGKSFRSVFLTENNFDDSTLQLLRDMPCSYIVFQTEIGSETKQLHYHCLIRFKNCMRFRTLKAKIPRANIQAVRNLEKARNYCLKDETFNGTRYERNGDTVITDIRECYQQGVSNKVTIYRKCECSLKGRFPEICDRHKKGFSSMIDEMLKSEREEKKILMGNDPYTKWYKACDVTYDGFRN